jgi:hypothetical protein
MSNKKCSVMMCENEGRRLIHGFCLYIKKDRKLLKIEDDDDISYKATLRKRKFIFFLKYF